MFTGLIEELGTVQSVHQIPEGKNFVIAAKKVLKRISEGESIAIDGTCLTVVSYSDNTFIAQAVGETLIRSTLKDFKSGTVVNLERAMAADGRFGGHFVQGHVDGIGMITDIRNTGNAAQFTIDVPVTLSRYVVHKGSIAINGISLTVAEKSANRIMIAIIPATLKETNLHLKKVHDYVNIEVDMLAKYIEQFVSNPDIKKEAITKDTLKKWGYFES